MRIGVTTGGGDAPGLNAVIRAIVLSALSRDWEVLGVQKGFGGLLGDASVIPLDRDAVRGITHRGGTILGTTNRGNPFRWPLLQPDGTSVEADRSDELVAAVQQLELKAMIVVGGEGTLHIAGRLCELGVPIVGVPKTIDNDVAGTVVTFGFDTAVQTATEAIDKVHSTAESHERVMVVEVMGRHAGWIALHSGLAGSADVILIPEIPFDIDRVCEKIRQRESRGIYFSIVVVAEGAHPKDGAPIYQGDAGEQRLGGIGKAVAAGIEERLGKETRELTLGHLQRGGTPTTFDRLLGLRFGAAAVRAVSEGQFGRMVALDPPEVRMVDISTAVKGPRLVDLDSDIIRTARELGTGLGD